MEFTWGSIDEVYEIISKHACMGRTGDLECNGIIMAKMGSLEHNIKKKEEKKGGEFN